MSKQRNVATDPSTHHKLKQIAKHEDRSLVAVLRRLIDKQYENIFGTKKTWNDENKNIKQNQGRS